MQIIKHFPLAKCSIFGYQNNLEFVVKNEPDKQGFVEKIQLFHPFPQLSHRSKVGRPWEIKWKLEAKNKFRVGVTRPNFSGLLKNTNVILTITPTMFYSIKFFKKRKGAPKSPILLYFGPYLKPPFADYKALPLGKMFNIWLPKQLRICSKKWAWQTGLCRKNSTFSSFPPAKPQVKSGSTLRNKMKIRS